MQEQSSLNPADRELEAALARLRPARPAFDASSILGRRLESSRRRLVIWRTASAALAACLVVSFFARPRVREVRQIILMPADSAQTIEAHPAAPPELSPLSYIMLRQGILDDPGLPATVPAHRHFVPARNVPGRILNPHDNLRTLNRTATEQL